MEKRSAEERRQFAKEILLKHAEAWQGEIVPLKKFGEFSAGVYSSRYVANLLSRREGPKGAFKIGRNTILPKSSCIEFLIERMEVAA